jgi:hypothetical protein
MQYTDSVFDLYIYIYAKKKQFILKAPLTE